MSTCDHCQTPLSGQPYAPIRTRRGMLVHACPGCGLLQSLSTMAYTSHPPPSMSCDADRASIKYTKDIIGEAHFDLLREHAGLDRARSMVDIGANRGAMLRRCLEVPSIRRIVAVESDPSLPPTYPKNPKIEAHGDRLEAVELGEEAFDLVYCAHTLEHLPSATEGLRKIFRALRPGGRAFLAVPNLLDYQVESAAEFFIDTHTFHFVPDSFRALAEATGFAVIHENCANAFGEIEAILERPAPAVTLTTERRHAGRAAWAADYLQAYARDLATQRAGIAGRVRSLERFLADRAAIFWGAGRIFDSLVKIGGLAPDRIEVLVDKFLHTYLPEVHGRPVVSPAALSGRDQRIPVIICSDAYHENIRAEAAALGFENTHHYKEFV